MTLLKGDTGPYAAGETFEITGEATKTPDGDWQITSTTARRLRYCWGHGATAGGFRQFESATCSRCGRQLRWKPNGRSDGVHWFEGEPMCTPCARGRHDGCPCGFQITAEEAQLRHNHA